MSVDDHGLEAIRKAAIEITPGDKSEYRIRTTAVGTFTGTFSPTGLSKDFLLTTENATDVATAVPAGGNLTDRNAIGIRNLDSVETVYIGKSNVTADAALGTTSGWEIGPNEDLQLDITDAITLFARTESGKTVKIKIFEVA